MHNTNPTAAHEQLNAECLPPTCRFRSLSDRSVGNPTLPCILKEDLSGATVLPQACIPAYLNLC